jgi:ATP-dependent Lhr-like helicase
MSLPANSQTSESAEAVLREFHPAVRTWFERRFPDGPTAPQLGGWPQIRLGRNTLIAAPTGSGKTLSAFLVCIDRLYRKRLAGALDDRKVQVVYVSPLKALTVDIQQNLERPLLEIERISSELGFCPPELRVGVRSGDTPAAKRAWMLKHPPHFLITTPESLYLLLTADKSRSVLDQVDTVIVSRARGRGIQRTRERDAG